MGWEKREGRAYYYQKIRVGRQVKSKYLGRGETARNFADQVQHRRQERASEKAVFDEWRAEEARLDLTLDAWGREIMSAVHTAYTAAGYHQHKGQWRRRRHEAKTITG